MYKECINFLYDLKDLIVVKKKKIIFFENLFCLILLILKLDLF